MKQRVTTSGQSMIDLGDALQNVEEGKAGSIDSLVASAKNVIRDTGTAVRKEAAFTLRRMLLPERWAGYLVNRDRGGLDENELRVASAVVRDLAIHGWTIIEAGNHVQSGVPQVAGWTTATGCRSYTVRRDEHEALPEPGRNTVEDHLSALRGALDRAAEGESFADVHDCAEALLAAFGR